MGLAGQAAGGRVGIPRRGLHLGPAGVRRAVGGAGAHGHDCDKRWPAHHRGCVCVGGQCASELLLLVFNLMSVLG